MWKQRGVTGELGFVTNAMREGELAQKTEALGGVLQMIRMA